ncbi:pilus assembly protein [Paenibacillus sp. GSMTC-2017]|uniref:pilus assembly protein n=1 Tax=Paenibacillus sp. GSMTC-2017 TaxID=2794350 RepID=UPI0018D74D11|nr:pilus assembly protein [Paenibacillus sp. GSMTC-2017]MBH5317469.1 pilus assembly protein [Paenibacillus sp. GSMTC-2017]
MRRRKQWVHPTKRVSRAITSNQQGSIVVEAAIVMPIIVFVLLIFAVILSLCSAQMALHSAANQSVRQLAAHIYPVELARVQAAAAAGNAIPSGPALPVPLPNWTDIAAEAAEWLPNPTGEFVSSVLRGDFRPVQNMAATELGRGVIEPFVRQYANTSLLRPERINLKRITLPDLKNKEDLYIAIELEYEYPFKVPFINKPIVLREQSYERVWLSDAIGAKTTDPNTGEKANVSLQIVTIEPSPLRPGNKATVVVKTKPGEVVSLEVAYKSGKSQAKHLGKATADENGYVKWTWHVSGNTTPGIWELTAETPDGASSVSKHFSVEKKGVVSP